MKIECYEKFIKAKKIASKRPEVAFQILQKVLLFSQSPYSPSLALHKLKGRLNDVWSFSVESNLRIIIDRSDPDTVIFVNIGTHDQVY
jgi:mRNA-degrading endonuclease YafQ of YafQ-DinJ toxin-antitoxin module